MMTQSLLELYNNNQTKYLDTDKENPNHHYISKCYSELFDKFKNQPITMLEIGVASGGSLLMWNDFFESGTIYGLDIGSSFDERFDECIKNVQDISKIVLVESDAYQQDIVNTLPDFDIIIDDGPHTLESHLWFLEMYLPKLKKGGIAIIEDVVNIRWIEFYKKYVTNEYNHFTVDTDRSLEYNNLLFVIEKI